MGLLDDIKSTFASNNICPTESVFLDFRPDNPDSVVCIHEYPGPPVIIGSHAVGRRVQIEVRDLDDVVCRQKINSIFKLIADPLNNIVDLNGRLVVTRALQVPFKLEIDSKNRTIMVFNLGIETTFD